MSDVRRQMTTQKQQTNDVRKKKRGPKPHPKKDKVIAKAKTLIEKYPEKEKLEVAHSMEIFKLLCDKTKMEKRFPGQEIGEIDFSQWDDFVKLWPGKRYYFVFAVYSSNSTFAGKAQGTTAFERAMSQCEHKMDGVFAVKLIKSN